MVAAVSPARRSWLREHEGWVTFFGALVVGLATLIILIACLAYGGKWYAFAVPGVGIVLFLGFTMLAHYRHPDQAEAAIKHGIAAGFVGVYFTALGLSMLKTGTRKTVEFDPSLLKYLTVAVGVIVTGYFGATALAAKRASGSTAPTSPKDTRDADGSAGRGGTDRARG